MKINELFDRSYEYKEANEEEYYFTTDDGRVFEVFVGIEYLNSDSMLEIGFSEIDPQKRIQRFDNTGKRDAYRIYATVQKILLDIVKDLKPTYIEFEADPSEPSKLKLYKRFAKLGIPGYEFYEKAEEMTHTTYRLKRQEADLSEELLNELKPSQAKELSRSNFTPAKFVYKLKRWGYELVGRGLYSEVWASPNTNIVVKVSKEGDDCFKKYAELVKKNKGNPHFPRIAHYQTISVDSMEEYFMAYLEKLEPINEDMEKAATFCDRTFSALNRDAVTPYHLHNELDNQDLPYVMDEGAYNYITHQLIDVLALLAENIPNNCRNDLHRGNFMSRRDTLVIIDPWAYV